MQNSLQRLLSLLFVVVPIAICWSGASASNPTKQYVLSPIQTGLEFDSLRIKSKGSTLAGWWLQGKEAKTVLIIAGSDAGNMSYSLPIATEFVNDLGWNVLLFDYRGFGASDSFDIDPDILAYPEFVDDIKAAVSFAKKRSPKAKIILWGRSLGASLAMAAVAEGATVDQLIVESPYLPTQAIFTERINAMRKAAGSERVTRFIASNRLEPLKAARKVKTPTHFIVGDRERLITQDDMDKLSHITKGMSSLFVAKDSDHLEFPNKNIDDFPAFVKETIEAKVKRMK